ncbi:hypothetical protein [Cohnella mopanensis]|uniref:hypothetical protein n=1 Tax=Cohnella mopanensis TaxID=2911966 RepID=UPI001EF80824|nr:hypothetical protein [Cohnella mopanensis]
MNESGEWGNNEYPLPPSPDEGERAQQQQHQQPWSGYAIPNGYPQGHKRIARKRKWISGILAFLVPGIGHMYLGLMIKAIAIMLLVAFDITAIVYAADEGDNVLFIVLLSFVLLIIYFYSLFDAIQSTDIVNERKAMATGQLVGSPTAMQNGWSENAVKPAMEQSHGRSVPPVGILLLAGSGVVILILSGTNWTHWLFNSFGSMFGAIVLIGAGVGLWLWEGRSQHRKGN